MKPTPQRDFPVNVSDERDEHAVELGMHYEHMFDIELNHSMAISVVPAFPREPWPPRLADEALASQSEARRAIVAAAQLIVTPDDTRADTVEVLADDECDERAIFYVSSAEFEGLSAELERLADRAGPKVPRVSELAAPILQRLLLERIVPSGCLSKHQLWVLGR